MIKNNRNVTAATIGNLISAHIEKDEEKFMIYANFIADAFEDNNDIRSAKIIRDHISGEYKNSPKVILDEVK